MAQSIWDLISPFTGLLDLLGHELPESLSELNGMTQVQLINQSRDRSIKSEINAAGMVQAEAMPLLSSGLIKRSLMQD